MTKIDYKDAAENPDRQYDSLGTIKNKVFIYTRFQPVFGERVSKFAGNKTGCGNC